MCKKLSIPYLWIDSLCIDQSNNAEKAEQVGIMGSIYRSAEVTVIAACGDSVHTGIHGISSVALHRAQLSESVLGYNVLEVKGHLVGHLNHSRWHTRGWAYQEACLSARCLIFTCERAYLTCSSGIQGEGLLTNDQSVLEGDVWTYSMYRDQPDTSSGNSLRDYPRVVRDFSCRTLGRSAESLAAVNAVFRQWELDSTTTFYYGHPELTFASSLLWSVAGSKRRFSKADEDKHLARAAFPTWSWPSCRYSVHYSTSCRPTGQSSRTETTSWVESGPWTIRLLAPLPTDASTELTDRACRLHSFSIPITVHVFPHPFTKVKNTTADHSYELIGSRPLSKWIAGVILDEKPTGSSKYPVPQGQSPDLRDLSLELLMVTTDRDNANATGYVRSCYKLLVIRRTSDGFHQRKGLAIFPADDYEVPVKYCVYNNLIEHENTRSWRGELPKMREFRLI